MPKRQPIGGYIFCEGVLLASKSFDSLSEQRVLTIVQYHPKFMPQADSV